MKSFPCRWLSQTLLNNPILPKTIKPDITDLFPLSTLSTYLTLSPAPKTISPFPQINAYG